MRYLGNTVIVVEHDEDTMLASDWLVDIGPGAGDNGGEIVADGTPKQVMRRKKSLTGQYLTGAQFITIPTERRKPDGRFIDVKGATENNLKNNDSKFPIGLFNYVNGLYVTCILTLYKHIL